MLVGAGLITELELVDHLESQANSKMKLGEFLIANEIVGEHDIIKLLSSQLHVAEYLSKDYSVDISLSGEFPAAMASKLQAVPLSKSEDTLTVAMVDPLDINAIDTIEETCLKVLIPVICTRTEFHQLLGNVYGVSSELGSAMSYIETGNDNVSIKDDSKSQALEISSLHDIAEGAPVVRMVNWIISEAVRQNASDIHISPEKDKIQLRFRIDGKLQEVPSPPKNFFLAVASRIKILSRMDIALSMIPQDGRFTVMVDNHEVNIRVSALPTTNGENMVLRLLDMSSGIYSLNQLGMCDSDFKLIQGVINQPYGMILSTGPTGSGKSTSLYAILQQINSPEINIITVEDPVEYRVESIRQVQLNHKAGMTFASALKSILRQDPDVIMIGEIRDLETASIAIRASLTGHRVLSTIHTNTAAGAIGRLVDMGVAPFLVSNTLLCTFAQRLVRKICPSCKAEVVPTYEELKAWNIDDDSIRFSEGKGCLDCMQTGYKGRTAIFEVLVIDSAIKTMIMKQCSSQEIVERAIADGNLRTLRDDAKSKLIAGKTSFTEACSMVMV